MLLSIDQQFTNVCKFQNFHFQKKKRKKKYFTNKNILPYFPLKNVQNTAKKY